MGPLTKQSMFQRVAKESALMTVSSAWRAPYIAMELLATPSDEIHHSAMALAADIRAFQNLSMRDILVYKLTWVTLSAESW